MQLYLFNNEIYEPKKLAALKKLLMAFKFMQYFQAFIPTLIGRCITQIVIKYFLSRFSHTLCGTVTHINCIKILQKYLDLIGANSKSAIVCQPSNMR